MATTVHSPWPGEGVAVGGWVSTDSEASLRAFGRAGYDFVGIDCQHGMMSEADAAAVLRRLDGFRPAVLVRVSDNTQALIGRVLDAGAEGVIVPLVNTARDAASAVAACRYPPLGQRSFGPTRPGLPRTPSELEGRVSCFAMIETGAGIENVDDICAVPGITGVIVGPVDLAISIGHEPKDIFTSEVLAAAVRNIGLSCTRHGKILGIFAAGDAARWVDRGCQLVIAGSDISLLNKALASELAAVRTTRETPPAQTSPYG